MDPLSVAAGVASIGTKLLGGWMSDQSAAKQQEANRALQREFAQSGIQWRVEDAKKAGIHPLYAMGAPTMSPAVSVSPSGMGAALSSMGQDISRAMTATASESTRAQSDMLQALTLERAGLQNDLLRTQIASINARMAQGGQRGPPMPEVGEDNSFRVPQDKIEGRPPVMMGGERVRTDPGTSPAKAFEDWLGDDIFSPGFLPNLVGAARQHWGEPSTWPVQMMRALWDRLSSEGKSEFGNFEQFLRRWGGGNVRNLGRR